MRIQLYGAKPPEVRLRDDVILTGASSLEFNRLSTSMVYPQMFYHEDMEHINSKLYRCTKEPPEKYVNRGNLTTIPEYAFLENIREQIGFEAVMEAMDWWDDVDPTARERIIGINKEEKVVTEEQLNEILEIWEV